jgi:WD40 repeat protein
MWDCTDLLTATPAHTEQPSTATSESAITEKRLQIRHFYSQQGHSGDILAIDTIRWHGVQYLITGSADSHVSVWTVEPTGLQLVIKQAAGAWVRSVQLVIGRSDSATDNLSITGQYEQLYAVYSGETQQCQILNVSSKTVVNPTPGENVNRCKIIPAADLGVAGLSNGVIVWQLSTNTILHRMVPSSTAYYIATYYDVGSSDHPLALTGMSSGAVYLLDLATGEVLMSGNSHSSNVMGTAFVSRNIGVSFSSDRSVHIWDFRKLTEDNCGLKPKRQLTQHTDIVVSGTYCEGILFSGAGDNKLLAWKPRLKHEVAGNSY